MVADALTLVVQTVLLGSVIGLGWIVLNNYWHGGSDDDDQAAR